VSVDELVLAKKKKPREKPSCWLIRINVPLFASSSRRFSFSVDSIVQWEL
jgi:hypothetical protein